MFHHNLRNNHAPQKFEKRPCSIQKLIWPCLAKIWETTMLHKNLRSDHAPSKNFRSDHANLRNDNVPPEFEAICHILGEHGHQFFDGAWSLLKFLWSMVVSQILLEHGCFYFFLVEHGRFSNFLMEHGRLSNFCGAWSFLKFWWNTFIFTFFGGAWSFLKFFGISHIITTSD